MLPEEKRKQLDGILSKMSQNGESEDAISFVVNDFKNKYSVQEQPKTFLEKTAGVLDTIFGGGKIGEAIGTKIAELSPAGQKLKQVEAQGLVPKGTTAENFKMPTTSELAGSALQSGALFIPGGAGAKAITSVATKAGLKTGTSALGKIGAGALAGEVFDVASNLQQGKTGTDALTPGWGAAIGGAIPAAGVARNVMVRFGHKQAPRVINSLIKPLAKDFSYGKNPGRAIAEEGIVANNFDDLINGIRDSRQRIGKSIGNLGDKLSEKPLLNIRFALNPLDEAAKIATSQNNPTLLARIGNVKRAITDVLEPNLDDAGNLAIKSVGSRDLENLTFKQARNILSDIGDLTAFTGNPSDDKLVNSALKQVYGAMKGETLKMADQINPTLAKDFRKLTEKYADLTSAEIATKYRDKIMERQNLVGLSPQTVGIGTGLITAVATGGATLPAILVGLTGATLDKLASTPAFKTRLAYILSTKTQQEANYLFRKIPALSKFFSTKGGVLPGDVILNKAKQIVKEVENIPNKQGGFIKIGNESDALMQEAKKYKSAEEFVNKQKPIYHGTPEKFSKFDTSISEGNATWFTADKADITNNTAGAVQPAGVKLNIMERYPNPGLKLATPKQAEQMYTDQLIAEGYAGVKYSKEEYGDYEWTKLFNPNEDTLTKSQLQDIWNKAQGQAGFSAKNPLIIGAGALGVGSAVANIPGRTMTYEAPKTAQTTPQITPEKLKEEISFRETGAVKGDPYKVVRKNTNGTYDIGKYQINTASLKAYADDYIGKTVTAKELIANPKLQEKFFEGYVNTMKKEGYDMDTIIAMWHRGWGNRDKARIDKMLKEDLTLKYLNNKPA